MTTRRSEPVLFYRPDGPFGWMSNWSPHAVEHEGVRFPTAEHLIMFRKAKEMGDDEIAAAIAKAETPARAKALGRKVRGYDDAKWTSARFDAAVLALTSKIRLHPELAEELAETGGRTIAEASPRDAGGGVGCGAHRARELTEIEWRGLNVLGKAWMEVRRRERISATDVA
jgi:ribA/ribD-fused uncharacterized protein